MNDYKLVSVKGTRTVTGTEAEAIRAAIVMDLELQPAFGVTIELDGTSIAEVRDGVVEELDY